MSVLRKVQKSLRRDGVVKTVALCFKNLAPKRHDVSPSTFDMEYGLKTNGIVELGDLKIGSRSEIWGIAYEPTPAGIVEHILALLPPSAERYSFVDLGSGKGRIVLMAARRPFKSVTGVEFSSELCDIAEANLVKFKPHVAAGGVQIICTDASSYDFPLGPLIVFFYHAFTKEILTGVLNRLGKRSDETIFIYYNVHYRELFTAAKVLHEEPGLCIWKLT